eukprot:7528377-Pyramimonas_sp.AAC.1
MALIVDEEKQGGDALDMVNQHINEVKALEYYETDDDDMQEDGAAGGWQGPGMTAPQFVTAPPPDAPRAGTWAPFGAPPAMQPPSPAACSHASQGPAEPRQRHDHTTAAAADAPCARC